MHAARLLPADTASLPITLRHTLKSETKLAVYLAFITKVTLRLAVGQSVSQSWCRAPSGAIDQIFITV
jgi:hypothetical protein